jgi:hypothetical protein
MAWRTGLPGLQARRVMQAKAFLNRFWAGILNSFQCPIACVQANPGRMAPM